MKKILIIGSGIAGLSCAIRSVELGNKVILVSPLPSERAQSVMAAGGINAALDTKGEGDTVEIHAEDTLKGGCNIASRDEVYGLCQAAPDIIYWLEQMGTVFTRDELGQIDLRAFGGQKNKRTAFAGACTGKQIMTALINRLRRYECDGSVERRLGLYFHSGLIADNQCFGALFYNEQSQQPESIYADCVVVASGGQNQVFGKTTGSMLCDGYVAGKLFEQGVHLKNLEFIQYHPTTIETPMKRMLITEAARGEGGRLFYLNEGKRVYFMEDLYGERGNLMPRDIVSNCIYNAPSQVYLDVAFLGKNLILQRLREVYNLCLDYLDLDITKEPIPVAPSVHFFMGGIKVNEKHQTNLSNLYAIGECAALYHGANRLGGNSLLAAIYGGHVAAKDISATAGSNHIDERQYKNFAAYTHKQEKKLTDLINNKSKFPVIYIKNELAKIMNDDLGISRTDKKLQDGLNSINYFLSIADSICFDPTVSLYQVYTLHGMLSLAKAIILSALERKESRGAHIRKDYPASKDEFACSSVAKYQNGEISIEFQKGDD